MLRLRYAQNRRVPSQRRNRQQWRSRPAAESYPHFDLQEHVIQQQNKEDGWGPQFPRVSPTKEDGEPAPASMGLGRPQLHWIPESPVGNEALTTAAHEATAARVMMESEPSLGCQWPKAEALHPFEENADKGWDAQQRPVNSGPHPRQGVLRGESAQLRQWFRSRCPGSS